MRIRTGTPFATIPEWLLLARDLSDRAIRLYGLLARVADVNGAGVTSKARLAGRLGRSVDTVDRALAELVDAGAVLELELERGDMEYELAIEEPKHRKSAFELRKSASKSADDSLETKPYKETVRAEEADLRPVPIPRPDVERLCLLLADLIEANGARRPTITQGWRDAARLLLDRDGISFEEAEAGIRWAQGDDFWRANILSMPKYRQKFDTLRLQARRRTGHRGTAAAMMERAVQAHQEAGE